MSGCEDVRAELTAHLADGALPPHLAAHLSDCDVCLALWRDLRATASLVGRAPLEEAPPEDLEERVMAMVAMDDVAQLAQRAALEHQPPAGLEERVLGRARARPVRSAWARVAVALAPGLAAATVALAVLGARWYGESHHLHSRLEALQERFGTSGVPVQETVLTDRRSGSRAHVTLMSDTHTGPPRYHLLLRADHLKPTPPGLHYELWLIGPHGVVHSAAFVVGRSDTVLVNLPLSVDPLEYPTIELTIVPDAAGELVGGVSVAEGHLRSAPVP